MLYNEKGQKNRVFGKSPQKIVNSKQGAKGVTEERERIRGLVNLEEGRRWVSLRRNPTKKHHIIKLGKRRLEGCV